MSALHHRALRNAPVERVRLFQPDASSTDSQLATAMEKNFGVLHGFLKDGRLTPSALRKVAASPLGDSEELDQTIRVARELCDRPQLMDAVFSCDGDITRDSLRAAALGSPRNSSPSAFSQDPFHAQGNAQVVKAFQGLFEQLRDTSRDRMYFSKPYQYVKIASLESVMQDPYETDAQGHLVLDPYTGMPKPEHSELCVYTAKNILERPGLLRSLERANEARLFGPPQPAGYLSNKSLERWFEQDATRKAG
ncbi:type III secretion effector protein [Pseudomonas sp. SDO5271_S396]